MVYIHLSLDGMEKESVEYIYVWTSFLDRLLY